VPREVGGIPVSTSGYLVPVEQPVRPLPTFAGTDTLGRRRVGTLVSVRPTFNGKDWIRYDDVDGIRREGIFERSSWGEPERAERMPS
jgi:hypothetical protein